MTGPVVMFWVAVPAVGILLFLRSPRRLDLGVGILFGFAREEARRRIMPGAVAPV